jgi:uncharacterized protein YndB with AHSA1/START domain
VKLEIARRINAPIEAVFDAWLDAEGMKDWMGPAAGFRAEAELDPKAGGRFRISMHSAERGYDHTGEYRAIERPHRLQFTWHSDATGWQESLVTLELREDGAATRLTLRHEALPSQKEADDHTQGWTGIVERLDLKLAPQPWGAATGPA